MLTMYIVYTHFTVPAYIIGLNDGENSKLVGVRVRIHTHCIKKFMQNEITRKTREKIPSSRGYVCPIFNRDISVLISNYYQHMFNCHELLIITEGVGTEANFYFRKEESEMRSGRREKRRREVNETETEMRRNRRFFFFGHLNDGSIINT